MVKEMTESLSSLDSRAVVIVAGMMGIVVLAAMATGYSVEFGADGSVALTAPYAGGESGSLLVTTSL